MLPGGINIIGIYIFSTPDLINKNQAKLRQCINVVHKVTERNKITKNLMAHNERILLHICASTRKYPFTNLSFTLTSDGGNFIEEAVYLLSKACDELKFIR